MNCREELVRILEELKESGYKCYITPDTKENKVNNYLWGYIITPSENILSIERDGFPWKGWNLSLNYIPSRKLGSGCRCNIEPYLRISKEVVLHAEEAGLAYARELKATLHESLTAALNGTGIDDWTKKIGNMVEI